MSDSNVIYKRQFAILLFILTFTYKVSRLPPIVAEAVGSSGSLLIFIYMILEVILFLIVYRFILIDGNETLKNTVTYKVLMVVFAANFLIKAFIALSGTILFSLELLFENISPYEVILALMIPVTYIAYKGIRVIGRTSEACFPIIALVLLINFIFLKAKLIFSNNLPLLNGSFGELLTDGDKFFMWFGDLTPLIFVKLKSSRRNYVGLSMAASFLLVMIAIILMYAMYGPASEYISNFIVKIAGYNQFANKLGRLDWTGMIIWLIMSLLFAATYLWGFAEAVSNIAGKSKPAVFAGASMLLTALLLIPDFSEVVTFAMGGVRWLSVAANYVLPVILLIMAVIKKRKNARLDLLEVQYDQVA